MEGSAECDTLEPAVFYGSTRLDVLYDSVMNQNLSGPHLSSHVRHLYPAMLHQSKLYPPAVLLYQYLLH